VRALIRVLLKEPDGTGWTGCRDGINTHKLSHLHGVQGFSVVVYFSCFGGVKESKVIDTDNATTLAPMSKSLTNLDAVAKTRILSDLHGDCRPRRRDFKVF